MICSVSHSCVKLAHVKKLFIFYFILPTVMGIMPLSIMIDQDHICLIADHPFLVVLKNSDNLLMFLGRVNTI